MCNKRYVLVPVLVILNVVITGRAAHPPLASPQKGAAAEVSGEEKAFVRELYKRLSSWFEQELERYDKPIYEIRKSEYEIAHKIDRIQREQLLERQNLAEIDRDETRFNKLLREATDPEEKDRIAQRLAKLKIEREERLARLSELAAEEAKLSKSLAVQVKLNFAATKDLRKEREEIDKQRAELDRKWLKYQADWDGGSKSFASFRKYLLTTAAAAELMCNVIITSERNGETTTGATIKYQTPEQRQFGASPHTAKCPTKCDYEPMRAYRYYIWTERNNKATSSRDQIFNIVNQNESVTLVEAPER